MITVSGSAERAPYLPADHGLIAWSVPLDVASNSSLLSVEGGAGTLLLSRIRRIPSGLITNVHICVTNAGSGLTNGFAALFTAAGAQVGQTANQATAWQSVGMKTMALAGGPYAFAGGDAYVGFWYTGTTAPGVCRSGQGAIGAQATFGQSSGSFNAAIADTGLTTTAPSSLGAQSAATLHWWVAVS